MRKCLAPIHFGVVHRTNRETKKIFKEGDFEHVKSDSVSQKEKKGATRRTGWRGLSLFLEHIKKGASLFAAALAQ